VESHLPRFGSSALEQCPIVSARVRCWLRLRSRICPSLRCLRSERGRRSKVRSLSNLSGAEEEGRKGEKNTAYATNIDVARRAFAHRRCCVCLASPADDLTACGVWTLGRLTAPHSSSDSEWMGSQLCRALVTHSVLDHDRHERLWLADSGCEQWLQGCAQRSRQPLLTLVAPDTPDRAEPEDHLLLCSYTCVCGV